MNETGTIVFIQDENGKWKEASKEERVAMRIAAYKLSPVGNGKGGMIVLSTDINSNAGKGIWNTIKNKWLGTLINRMNRIKKVDKTVNEVSNANSISIAYSIGPNVFHGKYYDMKTNEAFDEHSFTIDLRGLPIKIVYQIAEKLCYEFNQQSVLVINHATNKSVYVQLKKVK